MPPTTLQIKTNALSRLLKEQKLYRQEVLDQQKFVQQMISKNADEYEIRKQQQVLEESQRMITELDKKVNEHTDDLKNYVANYEGEENLDAARGLLSS